MYSFHYLDYITASVVTLVHTEFRILPKELRDEVTNTVCRLNNNYW